MVLAPNFPVYSGLTIGGVCALADWRNMVRSPFTYREQLRCDHKAGSQQLFFMAVPHIDALAVGVTFAFLEVEILPAIFMIGLTTFFLSLVGVAVGNFFGARYKKRAELSGGILLILLGVKILLEHLGLF